jgi:hypothetical protein
VCVLRFCIGGVVFEIVLLSSLLLLLVVAWSEMGGGI